MAFPDGTSAWMLSHRTPILTQCPNRKALVLGRLLAFHKSASNVTYSAIASQKPSACVLFSVQHCRHCIQCSAAMITVFKQLCALIQGSAAMSTVFKQLCALIQCSAAMSTVFKQLCALASCKCQPCATGLGTDL